MVKIMAIFFMRTTIVKASRGKSAIASAAYQSGEKLYSERLGESYHYTGKEEIVFEEVLLPPEAPKEFQNREILWNKVEEANNKANSRFARQFVIAIPNEWEQEKAIVIAREFIQSSLVERGMIADWAYHEKKGKEGEPDNHHIHVLCTTRKVKPDGTWEKKEKKEYALDEKGERIPIIDPETGKQKVRVRERNGRVSEEKLWKRITVESNEWNSFVFIKQIKREWADLCNLHLEESERIDPRSNKERGLETLPYLHEGSCVREMTKRGIDTYIHEENFLRKKYNDTLNDLRSTIEQSRNQIDRAVEIVIQKEVNDGTISDRKTKHYGRGIRNNCRVSGDHRKLDERNRQIGKSNKIVITEQFATDLSKEQLTQLINKSTTLSSKSESNVCDETVKRKHRHRL